MSLNEVWEAASATPFTPLVDKDSQFAVGFNLLLVGKLRCLRSFDNRLLTILDSTGYDYALRPE
jgi:cell cycle checkpoint protein